MKRENILSLTRILPRAPSAEKLVTDINFDQYIYFHVLGKSTMCTTLVEAKFSFQTIANLAKSQFVDTTEYFFSLIQILNSLTPLIAWFGKFLQHLPSFS